MVVLVRPIVESDVAQAIDVVIGGSLNADFEDTSRVAAYWAAVEETRRRRGDVLIAEVASQVVGVCQVLIFQHFQHAGGWCCELESVHVRSDQRSQGIGSQLLVAAEAIARKRGCYRMQLTSRNVREDAHRFYVANGWVQTSQGFKKFFS
jgi:GNAT superfamily N-acetyltransferase